MITNRDWPVIAENEAEEFPSKMRSIVQGLAEFTDEANALGGELNIARDQSVQTIEQARDDSVAVINGHNSSALTYRNEAQQSASNAQASADLAEQARLAAQAAAAGDVIDDTSVSLLTTYSAQKLQQLVNAIIEDSASSTTSAYSSAKTDQLFKENAPSLARSLLF